MADIGRYTDNAATGLVGRDEYIVEQDEMGDSAPQDYLIRYIVQVLEEQFRAEGWMITANRNMYHPAVDNSQFLIVPDVAVFKGINIPQREQRRLKSWNMRRNPALLPPPIVIEVSSSETWDGDIEPDNKPRLYGLVGIREYFAYDPQDPAVWPQDYATRLLGWRYGPDRLPVAVEPNEQGWLWSEVLESWLVPDEMLMRFYDRNGQLRLTAAEAGQAAFNQSQQQLETERLANEQRLENERLANEQKLEAERLLAQQRLEAERLASQQQLEAERRQREAAEQANAELLRQIEELRRLQEGRS